jgi:hypothetical protein
MNNNFQKGDIIIFTKNIYSHNIGHKLLILAKQPCKILHKTEKHIVVLYKDKTFLLRNIETRMCNLKGLGKLLYE